MTANARYIPTSVLFQLEIVTLDFESNTYDLLMTIGNPKDKITPITAATADTKVIWPNSCGVNCLVKNGVKNIGPRP